MATKYKIYDGFETKAAAVRSANDLRKSGYNATVRKLSPQASGRLKWFVYIGGRRK